MHPCPLAQLGPAAGDRARHRKGPRGRALVRPGQQHLARPPPRHRIEETQRPVRPTDISTSTLSADRHDRLHSPAPSTAESFTASTKRDRGEVMPKPIHYADASPAVRAVFDDIKATRGV